MRRGPLTAGEKVQFTDRRSNKITDQLVPGGVTQTSHGIILHDDVIGQSEGSVVVTVSAKREAQINRIIRNASQQALEGERAPLRMAVRGDAPSVGRLCAVDAARRADHVSEGHRPSYSARRHPLRHARA